MRGIEPHFKDYESAAFDLPRSRLRGVQALTRLMMLRVAATIIALSISIDVLFQGQLQTIDWHGQRGLSFLYIGSRQLHQLCYLGESIPKLKSLPRCNLPPACASLKKKNALETRIEFTKVIVY